MELLDLHNLTQEERNVIMGVIRRDDDLRRRQENRISQIKQEIHGLRMSSVLRSGDDLSKMCARCKSPFGRISNTGEVCPACHFRVCRGCRESLLSKGWLCSLCFKENQLQWLSGEWMEKTAGRGGPSRFSHGTDLLRASLRIKHPNGGEEGQGDSGGRKAGKQNGQGLNADGLEEDVIIMGKLPAPSAASPKYQDRDPNGPSLNQLHPQTDRERGGASDQSSDTGHASPGRGRPSAGSTPQKSALSIPSVVATSHSGSNDERSVDDDDDDIDELFAKYRSRSQLGVSRSSIGGSRESLASVYSDAGEINYGRIPVSGEITFGLEFDPKLSALRIHLKGCKDLAPVNVKRNSSDPYVKVYLLPDKTRSGKQKSKIKKHTLNPVFNETLTYNISQGELENRTLWVTVWHNDRLGRNDFLGEVTIPMDTYRFGDSTPCTYTLEARTPDTVNEEAMQYKGDLVVSLKYVTPDNITETKKSKSKSKKSKSAAGSLGEIHAMIKSACNLTAARSNGASDPFVKGYLLPDRGKTSKQKTPVVKNSVNPTWSHILVFDGVDAMEVADRCLELTVWDHETLGTNQFLGGARLNLGRGSTKGVAVDWMDARGQESIAWQNMMERPNSWVDAKLPLRANMGKSNAKK